MPRNEGCANADDTERTRGATGLAVNRRSYLKLAGAAAGAATLVSGPASASFSRRGISFDRTVNMVTEAGCDPTGSEPCDRQIREAADDYTLLKFPEGEYKLTEKNFIYGKTNVGFLGTGDVRFSVPERFNEKLLVVDSGTGLLFEGIDIDLRADGATPGLHLGADDDLEIHDVEFIGQGIHPDSDPRGKGNGNPHVTKAFYPIVRSPDGTGTVRNLVAKNAGLMGAYNHGKGRTGVWIGMQNKGTVTLENAHIEGFPNNATYCSRTPGTVRIEGGIFRNNDVSQIRISSRDSYAKDASVQVDFDSSDSPNPTEVKNSAGVFLEGGPYGYGGAVIRDCDIAMRSVANSNGGVVVGPDGADHTVENTRMVVEENDVRAVYVYAPTGFGGRNPPPKPHTFEMHDVSITGDAAGNEAIQIRERPNSTIEGCCIEQTGGNRDGIVLKESSDNSIANTTINVTGNEVYSRGCDPNTNNISESGSCPAPDFNGSGSSLPHTLSIETADGRAAYTFSVSGDLEKSSANGATIDRNDTVAGSTAIGQGSNGGIDSYAFSGELVAFELEGEANVTVDGKPAHVGGLPDHVLKIDGTGARADYSFSVSGDIDNASAISKEDSISGSHATGAVGGGSDSYTFSGELEFFSLDGEANVTVDGKPAHVGGLPDHVLKIDGTGARADYSFSVSGDIDNASAISKEDSISGSHATGAVGGGSDSYTFSGDITEFSLSGDATVYLDGEAVDPGTFLPNTLTVDGLGTYTDYEFAVGGAIASNGGMTSEDDIDIGTKTATGAVGKGSDSYAFAGPVERLSVDSRIHIELDRSAGVVTVTGAGKHASYRLAVTGDLKPTPSLTTEDSIAGNEASGAISSGTDRYRYTGELSELIVEGYTSVSIS